MNKSVLVHKKEGKQNLCRSLAALGNLEKCFHRTRWHYLFPRRNEGNGIYTNRILMECLRNKDPQYMTTFLIPN